MDTNKAHEGQGGRCLGGGHRLVHPQIFPSLKKQQELQIVHNNTHGLVITLSGSVLFASNKSELLPAAQNRLNQVAEALMATKERRLTIEGHTDSQGSVSHNQKLSRERAETVRTYIISRGYPGDLITAQGIGEDKPIADNTSAEGRANNRRVEIVVNHAAPTLGSKIN